MKNILTFNKYFIILFIRKTGGTMAMHSAQTDESALALLGKRLAAFRIRNNWTQVKFAQISGVSKCTIERIERGDSVQVLNLIKVLRACNMLDAFLGIFPDDTPSPMQILQMGKVKTRRRASSPRKSTTAANIVAEKPWVWDEDK